MPVVFRWDGGVIALHSLRGDDRVPVLVACVCVWAVDGVQVEVAGVHFVVLVGLPVQFSYRCAVRAAVVVLGGGVAVVVGAFRRVSPGNAGERTQFDGDEAIVGEAARRRLYLGKLCSLARALCFVSWYQGVNDGVRAPVLPVVAVACHGFGAFVFGEYEVGG